MNNNTEGAQKLNIKKSLTLYGSNPPCRELDFDNTEENIIYENISQMVREDAEGSEEYEIYDFKKNECKNESCQHGAAGTSFAINTLRLLSQTRGDSVLYETADRERKMVELINSSSDGWVYVNSGRTKKVLPADVQCPRQTKRNDKETLVLCKNNNFEQVTRLKSNTTSQDSQVSEINAEFTPSQNGQNRQGKADMEQFNERYEMNGKIGVGKDVCTAVDAKRGENDPENDQHYINLSDNESEPDVSYVNVGERSLKTESPYTDMSHDLMDDEYVDMTPVTSQVSTENEYCNLCEEREKDSSKSENAGLHEVFKPLRADENIPERCRVLYGGNVPVKPRPTPRKRSNVDRASNIGASNHNPPRPTPRVRTKLTTSLPRQSPIGAALANSPSQNFNNVLRDKRDNRCVTSGDEGGLSSDLSDQSSKPLDTSLSELPLCDKSGHARVESPPPLVFTELHNCEKDLVEVLQDVPPKSVTSTSINTQKPPLAPPKSHNHKSDAFGNLDVVSNVSSKDMSTEQIDTQALPPLPPKSHNRKIKSDGSDKLGDVPNVPSEGMSAEPQEAQIPPPRPPKSHNQEYDEFDYLKVLPDISSDDIPSGPVGTHSPPPRPPKLHQSVHNTGRATVSTTLTREKNREMLVEVGEHNVISSSPPPLPPGPFKVDPLSSSLPHPPREHQAVPKKTESTVDQLSLHGRDQDVECRPPALIPRKSARELKKPQPTSVSSSFKKYNVQTQPQVNTAGDFTVGAQSPPPRPPKTSVQQISGVSSPEPFSPSRWGCEAPMLPTVAPPPPSTVPHTASALGLSEEKSQPTTPPNKYMFGIYLDEGPWYACRDVTSEFFPDNQSDGTYDYISDWVVQEKLPKESPNSESTSTNIQTVITERDNPCQYQNVTAAKHAGIPQKGTGDENKTTDQNGAATSNNRNQCNTVPNAHTEAKQKEQGKKSEKCGRLPKEIAENVVNQVELRSRGRNDDFEEIELLQLYLIAKQSLKD